MVETFKDKKITIMGLGLHGGGLASALFFLNEGAKLTITDLRSEEILKPTIKQLEKYNIKYTLGCHLDQDFTDADIVIKNPGVPSSSKYLKLAKRIETDISIFLNMTNAPIIAVTGSKGKSSTVSAIDFVLKKFNPKTKLGGNITVSPLTFVQDVDSETPVILELSSWQLADIQGKGCLKAEIATVTNIMNDHQNAYDCLDDYAADKAVIFQNLDGIAILNYDDSYSKFFRSKLIQEPLYIANCLKPKTFNGAFLDDQKQGWVQIEGKQELILKRELSLKGDHQRTNLLLAGLILYKFGVPTALIKDELAKFRGIAHRMELFHQKDGVKYYNDSAATIPEAVVAAVKSFTDPVRLISGGTDKELEFSSIKEVFKRPETIHLLKGTGTDKMIKVLKEQGINYFGPYSSLKELILDLIPTLKIGDNVLFSPGATSFGMFNNEFDRGNQFKDIISNI
ncbi:MAG: UDP-N-acetylmuramoyl-L-alanine--D-glutamate ligase [Spirochaetaceae bacterium]